MDAHEPPEEPQRTGELSQNSRRGHLPQSRNQPAHEHPHLDHLREEFEQVRDAAIEAEFDTGVREDTVEEARSHILVRLARMSFAVLLMITGVILLVLPGPGWLVLAIGFGVLAKDVAWAERTVRYIRRKAPGIPEDGRLPTSAIVTMVVFCVAGILASVWYFALR